jgi:hypothetical protein
VVKPDREGVDLILSMSTPWKLHPYQYVDQNPVVNWDPGGRGSWNDYVRTVASLLDAIENNRCMRATDRYGGQLDSFFRTPKQALEFMSEHTGIEFGPRVGIISSDGEYVIF